MGNPYLKALKEYKHGQRFICVKTGKESIVIEKIKLSYYGSNILGLNGTIYDADKDVWAVKI